MDTAVVPQQHIVALPAGEAAARLPRTVRDGGVTLHIDAADPLPGTAAPGSQRFPATWASQHRSGQGYVEVGPLSTRMAVVEVALPPRATRGHAEALRDFLEGRPQRPPPPSRRRRSLVPVAAGLAGLLVATALPAFAYLTRAQPVSFETATARYQEAAASEQPPAGPPPGAQAAPPTPAAAVAAEAPPPAPAADAVAVPVDPPPQPAPAEPPAQPEPAAAPAPARPEPGVYRYATTGWEELSMPGSRRSFPAETAQTVTHTPCGIQVSWQPLEERRDTFELCVEEGRSVLASVTTYRAFFGQAHEQHFTCTEVPAPSGAVWAVRCPDGGNTVMHVTARVERQETLTVAGQRVDTLRMRMDSRLEGDTSGTRDAAMWFREGDGLLVRTEVSSDMRVRGPFGPVQYREEHSLHLADLTAYR